MKEQLLETWRINNRMNLLLMDNITDEGMKKTLSPRGRTIYLQFVHMQNVRINWLEICAPGPCHNTGAAIQLYHWKEFFRFSHDH